MSQTTEAKQFAARLRTFKNRTNRSYEALARRTGVSSSSLHRYCVGIKIPVDYGTVHRFAQECGATQPEIRELHRLWALADAARRARRRSPASAPTEPVAGAQASSRVRVLGAAVLAVVTIGTAWWVRSGGRRSRWTDPKRQAAVM